MASERACIPVFLLPQGLTLTGVNTWAISVLRASHDAGFPAHALVHGSIEQHAEVVEKTVGITRLDVRALDPEALAPLYAQEFNRIASEHGSPIAPIPTRHDACFGAVAAIARETPGLLRPVLWQQNDSRYEDALIDHFEPMACAMVGASAHLRASIKRRHPGRTSDIDVIPNAVHIEPLTREYQSIGDRPLRLVYAGRVEHEQKRVGVLVKMSDELTTRGVSHELRIVGDGPALAEIAKQAHERHPARAEGAVSAEEVANYLRWADVFVLCSRHEGLSFALLEAMAAGCVPVITRTRSGAEEAIEDGVSGVLVDSVEDDGRLARAMSAGVERAQALGIERLAKGVHARVRKTFDLADHLASLRSLCVRLANLPPRMWPAGRVLSARDASVIRLRGQPILERVLEAYRASTFIIHGVGAHTRALERVIRQHADHIAAFTDDNPHVWGAELFGKPIVSPEHAAETGATDVVISSDLHEDAIWSRREVFERRGLRVHRLYADAET